MRILGLDLGDKWTGVAISDPSGIVCKPLKTVQTVELELFLVEFLATNQVAEIVYGLPLNHLGAAGEQAEKTILLVNQLKEIVTKKQFNDIKFTAWDERRSSKLALGSMRDTGRTRKTDKSAEHSIAAAFILQNYIDFKNLEQNF